MGCAHPTIILVEVDSSLTVSDTTIASTAIIVTTTSNPANVAYRSVTWCNTLLLIGIVLNMYFA
eukprot:6029920-Amphidinium_carterae.1